LQTSRSGLFRALMLAGILLAAAGCGHSPDVGQVAGTVRVGGRPLADVVVTFAPEGKIGDQRWRASGVTNAEGYYRLTGEDLRDVLAVGDYVVIVEDLAIHSAPRSPDGTVLELPPLRFPKNFSDPIRSPLHKRVQSGSQTVDLDL
jgi:hypothetical protein